MKKTYFKKALLTFVLAVLSGVFIFGANAVFGADPVEDPPGLAISPTFDNLTVDNNTFSTFIEADEMAAGFLDISSNIFNSTGDPLEIADNLDVLGDMDITGTIFFNGIIAGINDMVMSLSDGVKKMTLQSSASGNSILTEGGPLVINQVGGNDVVIGKDSTSLSDLDVVGNITANQMGTFKSVNSSGIAIPDLDFATNSVACPSGTQIVGCYVFQGLLNTLYTSYAYPNPSNDTCYVAAYNPNSSIWDPTLTAVAICHDPEVIL